MPGRGTPWRFEKGAKDRIGSADIKDDTITGADIKDLTITEADLDPAVTGKLNKTGGHTIQDEGTPLTQQSNLNFTGAGVVASVGGEDTTIVTIAGGGGGGSGEGTDLETTIVLEDEFLSNDDTSIHQAWNPIGQGGVTGNGVFPIKVGGVFDMFHNNGVVGDLFGLEHKGFTSNYENFDFTGNDCTGKFGVGFNALTDMSAFVGFFDATMADLQNPASIANLESNWSEAVYFRWHSTTSGNWFAVTMNGGTKTETDTGVAVTTQNIIKLKIEYTDATNVVFSINGSTVATHTTNLPATDLGMIIGGATLSVPNTNGDEFNNPHGIDYFQVTQPRL